MEQINKGNLDSALFYLDRSLFFGKSPEVFFTRGYVYQETGEDNRAIADYTAVINLRNTFSEAYFKRGELYLKNGIYAEALADFNHLIDYSGRQNTQAVFFRIDPLGKEQVKVSSLAGMLPVVKALRSEVYRAMGEYRKALSDINAAIAVDSTSQNLVNRAMLLEETGQRTAAIENLRWAVSLDGNSQVAWLNLALLDNDVEIPESLFSDASFTPMLTYRAVQAYEEGDIDQAERLFNQALKINNDDPLLLLNAGRLNIKKGLYGKARRQFLTALDLDDGRLEAYYLIGNTFFREQKFTEASAYYEQFLVRDRSNGQVWYNAAMTYFAMGHNGEACQYLNEAASRGMEAAKKQMKSNCPHHQ